MMVACNNTPAMFQMLLPRNTLFMEAITKIKHSHLYLCQDQHQTTSPPRMEGLSLLISPGWSTLFILNTVTRAMFITTSNLQIQADKALFHNILFPLTHHLFVQVLTSKTVEASMLAM